MSNTFLTALQTASLGEPTRALMAQVLSFIDQDGCSDADFNTLALAVFAHQFEHNIAFQKFCQQRGRTRRTVRSWRDIPAVPINIFKELSLNCEPVRGPEAGHRVFMTSGTTRAVRGCHHHPALAVYDASMTRAFETFFMQGQARLPMAILFPTEQVMPNSSLAHYLALAKTHFGTDESRYFLNEQGLDVAGLSAWLQQSQDSGQPVAVLGASYSLVHAMDALSDQGLRFALPAGSRVLDTGGFKGQSREIAAADFYAQLTATFGVAASGCINMYGMTELSTQMYDAGNAQQPAVKFGPHWIRSRVVDPLTGADMPEGQAGVLVHCDLANVNSVCTILTEDVGVLVDGGFHLLGRAQGTQAKGCSLAVEDFLKAARP